jgi:hypothetical protein
MSSNAAALIGVDVFGASIQFLGVKVKAAP